VICHLTRVLSQKNNDEVHSHLRCLVEKLFPFKFPKLDQRWFPSKLGPSHPCHTFRVALPPTIIYCEPCAYDMPFVG
jgi:hypothetical protein